MAFSGYAIFLIPCAWEKSQNKFKLLNPVLFFKVIKDVCSEKSLKAPNYHDIRAHDESKLLMISLSKSSSLFVFMFLLCKAIKHESYLKVNHDI